MESLSQYIRTTDERDLIITELHQLFDSLHKVDKSQFSAILNKEVSVRTAEVVHTAIAEANVPNEDFSALENCLQTLKQELMLLTTVEITLAIKPQHEFLTQLYRWVQEHVGKQTIIQLAINPEIVGGIILVYQGKYINLSLSKRIDDVFTQHSHEILSLLS